MHRKHVQTVIHSPGACKPSSFPGVQRSGAVFYLDWRYLGSTSSPDSKHEKKRQQCEPALETQALLKTQAQHNVIGAVRFRVAQTRGVCDAISG